MSDPIKTMIENLRERKMAIVDATVIEALESLNGEVEILWRNVDRIAKLVDHPSLGWQPPGLLIAHWDHTVHIVRPGDTLSSIAAHYKVKPEAFADAIDRLVYLNRIPNRDLIHVGWYLIVPTDIPTPPSNTWIDAGRATLLADAVRKFLTESPWDIRVSGLRAALNKFEFGK